MIDGVVGGSNRDMGRTIGSSSRRRRKQNTGMGGKEHGRLALRGASRIGAEQRSERERVE